MSLDFKNKILNEFADFTNKLNGQQTSKIHSIRKLALQSLKNLEVPTMKDEEWRYTNLNFLSKHDFNFSHKNPDIQLDVEDIEDFMIKDIEANILVFVNGAFSEKLSRISYPRDEIIVESFAAAEKRNAPNLIKHFTNHAKYENDFFTAMNSAYSNDGVYINIPGGVYIDEPIHIMFITDSRNGAILSNPHNVILVGKCSQVKLIETYHTIGDNPAFTNMVSEIVLDFATNVEFSKIQNDKGNSFYIGTTHVSQAKNSSLTSANLTLSGRFVRNNLKTVFNEENAEANLYGFYFMKNDDFVDNHTAIDHAVPNCISNEFYKGILDQKSRAVFSGKVLVRQDAQKTNAFQTNKNILLTDDAKINTKPQLEIYADDVKCSHGATTGYFDKEALFYFKARGISETMAKSLLLNAYASEIIEKIKISALRDSIKRQVAERLTVDDIYFCDVLADVFEQAGV